MRRRRESDGTIADPPDPNPPCATMSLPIMHARALCTIPRRGVSLPIARARLCGTGPRAPLWIMWRADGCYPHGVPWRPDVPPRNKAGRSSKEQTSIISHSCLSFKESIGLECSLEPVIRRFSSHLRSTLRLSYGGQAVVEQSLRFFVRRLSSVVEQLTCNE